MKFFAKLTSEVKTEGSIPHSPNLSLETSILSSF